MNEMARERKATLRVRSVETLRMEETVLLKKANNWHIGRQFTASASGVD
jgi:hypothetical protein